MGDAPPIAADHAVVMDVVESPGIGSGPNRRTIIRSGQWVREERAYADRTETAYADLAAGTTYRIVRDPAGAVQRLTVERYRAGDRVHAVSRAATGRRDNALGEACEIWAITGQYYHVESCETADGIQLWSRFPSPGAGPDIFAARAISIERRPVRPEEVRPPADFFRLAPWPTLSATGQAGYEVRLVSTTRGEARVQVRRQRADSGSGRSDSDDGTRYFWASNGIARYSYRAEADGRPIKLEVELRSASPFGGAFRRLDRWVPVRDRRVRTVLGERCTWQDETSIQSTDIHYECRTRDGIPLMLEDDWHWDDVTDIWTARSLARRALTEGDMAPPPPAVDWAAWGVAPRQ